MEGSINYNLVLFSSIRNQITHITQGWAMINLLGNIIPFIPFGFLLPITYRSIDTFLKVVVVGFFSVVFIETIQFLTKLGSFDIDDIILNMIGIACGYILIWLINRIFIKGMININV